MWLIEFFISEEYRQQRIGAELFAELKRIAREKSYSRLEWFIIGNNTEAKSFYQKMGGVKTDHTERWRLELAESKPV